MPRFTWRCEGCEHEEDVDRSAEERHIPPDYECPECLEVEKWERSFKTGGYRWRFCD